MSGPQRLSIVLSASWIGLMGLAYSIDSGPFQWDGFAFFGVAPVALAVGLPWGIWWVIAGFRQKTREAVPVKSPPSSPNTQTVLEQLQESGGLIHWVHARLDGLKVPDLPTSKRVQLTGACWHLVVEHHGAVVVLVESGLHGSALALLRPAFESFVRGLWLLLAASDAEVGNASRDDFPNDFFGKIVRDLEQPGILDEGKLSWIKGPQWKQLCSYTHTGYQQIGARLTSEGLGYQYQNVELAGALTMADSLCLMCLIHFAGLAEMRGFNSKPANGYARLAS